MPRYFDDEPRSPRYDDEEDYPRRRYRADDYDDDDYDDRRRRRRNATHTWLIVLGVLAFLVVAGAVAVVVAVVELAQMEPGPEERQAAMAYNQLITHASDRFFQDFQTFDRTVQQALDEGGNDSASVRRDHHAMKKSLDDTGAQMRTWIVPKNHTARLVHEEFQKYLRQREVACRKLAQVAVILDDRTLTLAEKRQQTEELLRAWDETDRNDLAPLQLLQGDMADEFDFP